MVNKFGRYILLILGLFCGTVYSQQDSTQSRHGISLYATGGIGKGFGVNYDVSDRIRTSVMVQKRSWYSLLVRDPHRPPGRPFMDLEQDFHEQLRCFADVEYEFHRNFYAGVFCGLIKRQSQYWFSEFTTPNPIEKEDVREYSLPHTRFQYYGGPMISYQYTAERGFFFATAVGVGVRFHSWRGELDEPLRVTHPEDYQYLDQRYQNDALVRIELRLGYNIRWEKQLF